MSRTNAPLIVRLPNWVGDVVMALPALLAMRKTGIKLQLFGKPWITDLLAETHLALNQLSPRFWQSTKKMAKDLETDRVLLLTNSFSSALMARLAGKTAIGYSTDLRQWLLEARIKPGIQHEVEYFWRIARFASQYWFPGLQWLEHIPTTIKLPIHKTSISSAKQRLQLANINRPFWVLCPFAQGKGNHGQSKIWSHWRELSKQLHQYPLVVCPGKNEEILCKELVPEAIVLSGLNLNEYAATMAMAEKIIANDSGPMHIAAAVNANTLGIFGVSDPKRTRPWGGDHIGTLGQWPTLSEVLQRIEPPPVRPRLFK